MYLVDGTGAIVAAYAYDPYGSIISATGPMAEINPLRYRGYYYDAELEMYYLQSRYYDPMVGRFINADEYAVLAYSNRAILGNNLFAYCFNNPVSNSDPEGYVAARVIISAAIGGVVGAVLDAIFQRIQGRAWNKLDWGSIGIEFLNGALTGALIGLGLPAKQTTFGRALINMVTSIAHSIRTKANFWNAIGAALISGLGTYFWGKGMDAAGKSVVTNSMITSIVQTIKTRFARVTLRVSWWTITISI